jgi:flavin-binding protein dodecin
MRGIIDSPSTRRQCGSTAGGGRGLGDLSREPSPDQRKTIGVGVDAIHDEPQRTDNSLTSQEVTMAVRKSINIAGSGPTIEASIHEAIDRAYTTLEGITRFEVTKISGDLTDAGPVFDVEVTIWFTLLERMHE